jgi:hypothetical protein
VTFGVDVASNGSSRRLTVDRVTFKTSHGMTLVKPLVATVPSRGAGTLVGTWDGYPPDFSGSDDAVRKVFDGAQKVPGAVIPAGRSHLANFVFGVRAARGASAGPLMVDYHDNKGTKFRWTGNITYRIATGASC